VGQEEGEEGGREGGREGVPDKESYRLQKRESCPSAPQGGEC
jgi:hypothetical protein